MPVTAFRTTPNIRCRTITRPDPVVSTPPPPFQLSELSTPLTAVQRQKIIAWCHAASVTEAMDGWSNSALPANFDSLPDDQLLGYYRLEAGIQQITMPGITLNPLKGGSLVNPATGQDVQNPIKSVEEFLTLLSNKNLWIRVAEFGLGGVFIAVGLNAVLRPGKSLSSGVAKAVTPLRVINRAVNQQGPKTSAKSHTSSVTTLGSRSHSIHYER